jgi:thiamine biosynthesis lipoprotein
MWPWLQTPETGTAVPAARTELSVARRAMACEFAVVLPGETRTGVAAACAALDEIERLEEVLSVFRGESEAALLNRGAANAPFEASPDLYRLIRLSVILSRATEGAFDAASGALVRAWGFLHGPKRVPSEAERRDALAASGSRHVFLDDALRTVYLRQTGVEFNFGAIGKGYALDRAARLLRETHGIHRALLHGGRSSLCALGAPPATPRGWAVELGDPRGSGRAIGRVWLRDRAMGTSGTAHQYFVAGGRRYGHILDPRNGWPACQVLSATALAPTAAEADALSTAFFVVGVEATRDFCRRHRRLGAMLVLPNKASLEVLTFGETGFEVM